MREAQLPLGGGGGGGERKEKKLFFLFFLSRIMQFYFAHEQLLKSPVFM